VDIHQLGEQGEVIRDGIIVHMRDEDKKSLGECPRLFDYFA